MKLFLFSFACFCFSKNEEKKSYRKCRCMDAVNIRNCVILHEIESIFCFLCFALQQIIYLEFFFFPFFIGIHCCTLLCTFIYGYIETKNSIFLYHFVCAVVG